MKLKDLDTVVDLKKELSSCRNVATQLSTSNKEELSEYLLARRLESGAIEYTELSKVTIKEVQKEISRIENKLRKLGAIT